MLGRSSQYQCPWGVPRYIDFLEGAVLPVDPSDEVVKRFEANYHYDSDSEDEEDSAEEQGRSGKVPDADKVTTKP